MQEQDCTEVDLCGSDHSLECQLELNNKMIKFRGRKFRSLSDQATRFVITLQPGIPDVTDKQDIKLPLMSVIHQMVHFRYSSRYDCETDRAPV